jgi:hypothetical protein
MFVGDPAGAYVLHSPHTSVYKVYVCSVRLCLTEDLVVAHTAGLAFIR